MKKTQMALAAVALVASSAVLADGVTAYGTIDASVVSNSSGTAFAGAGNNAGTIFGFKGSEDLGGGLKAGFNLEAGVNAGTGATGANGGIGSAVFNRQSNVFVGNETLTVTAGTQLSPYIGALLTGVTGVGGNGAFVPGLARVDGGSLATYSTYTQPDTSTDAATNTGGFFIGNAISGTVNAGGLSASYLYRVAGAADTSSLTKGKGDAGSKYSAASVSGSFAGVNLAIAYQDIKAVNTSDAATGLADTNANRTNTAIAGNTSIGDVRLNAVYSRNTIDSVAHNGYLVGASMPIVGALSAGVTYASSGLAALGNQTTVSAQYSLSKATFGYASYSSFSVDAGGGGASANDNGGLAAKKSLLAVGLAHSF